MLPLDVCCWTDGISVILPELNRLSARITPHAFTCGINKGAEADTRHLEPRLEGIAEVSIPCFDDRAIIWTHPIEGGSDGGMEKDILCALLPQLRPGGANRGEPDPQGKAG